MKIYKGINYLIKINPRLGFPLAYIKLPENHKWIKEDCSEIPLDVHGGLTFKETITGKEKGEDNWWGFTKGTWIGWDYGHYGDYMFEDYKIGLKGKTWDYEEVEAEVKKAIRQLLKLSEPKK